MSDITPQSDPDALSATLPSSKRSAPVWMLVATSALAVVFFGLWLSARSDASDAQAQVDELEAEAEAEAQAAAALPDLEEIAGEHRMGSSGALQSASETSISLNFSGSEDLTDLEDMLDELGFSAGIMDRIGNTRALDGTLTASGDQVTASWTYHPDDGLSLVLERDD